MNYNVKEGRKLLNPTQGKLFQEMCPRNGTIPLTKLQVKMAKYLDEEKEQKWGKFLLVFVAEGPCCKYLESKSKSQHPSTLSLLWTWNPRDHHA